MTFGGYRLDAGTRQLFRGTSEVRLSPKAFDLLLYLVENRPRAVSKKALHDRLWPATFVTESNLASLIAELRRALGDRVTTPKFIRTVHRFGYAFCGEIPDGEESGVEPGRPGCWIIWQGRETPMRLGENIIGRDAAASLLLDLPSVSRRHARLVVTPDGATIEDLGSKNGTFVGTVQLTGSARLKDRDEIQVGSAKMTVRLLSGDETTETTDR